MSILTSLLSGSFPIGTVAKIAAVVAILSATFYAGHHVGELQASNAAQVQITKANKATTDLQKEYDQAKNDWLTEKAVAAAAVASAVQASIKEARAKEEAAQAKIAQINNSWATQLRKVQNDLQTAIELARHPVVTADPVTDGMWVDAYACGSPADTTGANGVPQAGGGTADAPLRCRLHSSTAERLIKRAAEANQVVNDYNSCVDSLRVLSPASFPISP